MDLRSKHKDAFFKNHGLKLGFMSAFTKAASYALQAMPVVNAGKAKFYIPVFRNSFVYYSPKPGTDYLGANQHDST